MARSNAGKWVSRAASTGGGRSSRSSTPVNWYATLVVICVLGVLSVLFAIHDYRGGSTGGTTSTPPTVKQTWYVGQSFDICGTQVPNLASNEPTTTKSTKRGFFTTGDGVITVAPPTTTDAGKNAVYGKFVDGYKGLTVTTTHIHIPGAKGAVTLSNGDKCHSGSPDAGKVGQVEVHYWPSAFTAKSKGTELSGNPATLRFSANQLITVAFVPAGSSVPKPNGSVVTSLIDAANGTSPTASSTTLPSAATTATTAASATTSSTAPTTTSVPATTSTTKPKKS